MSLVHGKKQYLQILLDRSRYDLLEEIAARDKVRVTEAARKAIYAYLERVCEASQYKAALAMDEAAWAASVRNRVEGKISKKIKQIIDPAV